MYFVCAVRNLFRKFGPINFSKNSLSTGSNWESLQPAFTSSSHIVILAPLCGTPAWQGGFWICQDTPQEGPPKEDMTAKDTVGTSQYGLINYESVPTGLNIWTIIITLGILLALVYV